MSETATLDATARETKGKKASKRLRMTGELPAVVYGHEIEPVRCQVNRRTFERLVHEHGRNAIITLSVNGGDSNGTHSTIIKDVQHHPVNGSILHVDFHRISLTERIVVEIEVNSVGVPSGVRNEGGILEQRLHLLEVECLPTAIPDSIEIDVTALEIGDTIHVSDITPPADSEFVTEGERSIFVVVPPSVRAADDEDAEAADAGEDEEGKEPELVDERGKKDDEDEEA